MIPLSISVTAEEYAALKTIAGWLGLKSREAVVIWSMHATLNAVLAKGSKVTKPSLWVKLKEFFNHHPEVTSGN